MRIRLLYVASIVALTVGAIPTAGTASDTTSFSPTHSVELMVREMRANPDKPRLDNVRQYLPAVRTDLSSLERFHLGEVYFLNLMPNEARDTYWHFVKDRGPLGRVAWQRIMQIRFRAYGMVEQVERDVLDYRATYPRSAINLDHLYNQTCNLSTMAVADGRFDQALSLIRAEVETLSVSGPYTSFRLVPQFLVAFHRDGRLQDAAELLEFQRSALSYIARRLDHERTNQDLELRQLVVTPDGFEFSSTITHDQLLQRTKRLMAELEDGLRRIAKNDADDWTAELDTLSLPRPYRHCNP